MICFSGVTILLSLTVFSQVLADTMPATSDAIPLLGNFKANLKGIQTNMYTTYSPTNFMYARQAATYSYYHQCGHYYSFSFHLKQLKANQINRCKKYII